MKVMKYQLTNELVTPIAVYMITRMMFVSEENEKKNTINKDTHITYRYIDSEKVELRIGFDG